MPAGGHTKSVELRVGEAWHSSVLPKPAGEKVHVVRKLGLGNLLNRTASQRYFVTWTFHRWAIAGGQRPVDVDRLFGGKNAGAAANTNSGISGIDRRLTGVAPPTTRIAPLASDTAMWPLPFAGL